MQRRLPHCAILMISLALLFNSPLSAQSSQAAQPISLEQLIAQKESRSPAERKIESNILDKINLIRQAGITPQNALLRNVAQFNDTRGVQIDGQGRIYVYLRPTKSASFNQLTSLALQNSAILGATNEEFKIVQAWVPFEKMTSLASESSIASIQPVLNPITNTGSVISQGVDKSRTTAIRLRYDIRGAGVKVGVLSDGCNGFQQSIASGDLIGLEVIDNSAGGAEGTAMLEIIQDLAPQSNLAFATAFGGIGAFINNIQALANAGCKVITDDVRYFGEPVYEDGPIARKVNDVATINDAVYTSSAGNNNRETYASNLYLGTASVTLPSLTGTVHNFGTELSPDDNQTFTAPGSSGVSVELQWADAFGGSTNDYDLYIINNANNNVVSSGTSTQNGTQDPIEFATLSAGGTFRVVVHLKSGNPVPFKIFYRSFAGTDNVSLSSPAASGFGNTGGHAAAVGSLGTAAVNAGTTATTGTPSVIQGFSARGPVEIYNGGYPNLAEVRVKPDLTSFDGVRVTGNGGFPTTFFGTSAAAPHVAGIAALVRSANRSLNAATVRDILRNTALDLGSPGADSIFGFGRADAYTAVTAALNGIASLNSPSIEIPDNDTNGISRVFSISNSGTVSSVAVTFSTTHTRLGDLVLTLQSPTGTTRTLINRSGSTLGNSTAQRPHLALDNRATALISTNQTNQNLIGYFRPVPDTFNFQGEPLSGDWTLRVSDRAANNTGIVQQWGIIFNSEVPSSAPVFVSSPVSTVLVGDNYSYSVVAAGNPRPTLSLTTAPNGMSINTVTGVISWNTSGVSTGFYPVVIQAQNSEGTLTQEFSVQVRESDWRRQTPASALSNFQFYEIAPAGGNDTLNLWAVGSQSLTSGPSRVMRTNDGGNTWENATGNLTTQGRAFTIGAATASIAVVGFENGGAFRTIDGGATWTAVSWPTPVNTFMNRVLFTSPTIGYAQGDNAVGNPKWPVYKTTDAGATWSITGSPNIFPNEFGQNSGMFFFNSDIGWYTGYVADGQPSRLYRTTDGAATWSTTTIPQATGFNINIASPDAQNVYVMTQTATPTVRRSTDGGLSFVNPSPGLTTIPTGIASIPNSNLLFATTSTGILKSTDGGDTWAPEAIPTTITGLNFILFVNATNGWVAGANGVIGKYSPSGTSSSGTGGFGSEKPMSFKLLQNYPNPFNPSTIINFQLASIADVKLEVFDLLGRRVATLVNERKAAGNYDVRFNASSLSSGVYFYRLQAGSFVETKKMLFIK